MFIDDLRQNYCTLNSHESRSVVSDGLTKYITDDGLTKYLQKQRK